jgi:hypothetical protein
VATRRDDLVARILVVHDGKVLAARHRHPDGDEFWCLAGVVWLQDLPQRHRFEVVFAGWLAAGHAGVLSVQPEQHAARDRHLVEIAWRRPADLLAEDFRPASLLKALDLGNLPELPRPEA